MKTLNFWVPGPPVPQARAEVNIRNGRVTGKRDPGHCKTFKALVRSHGLVAAADPDCDITIPVPKHIPVALGLVFVLPRLKSISKTGKKSFWRSDWPVAGADLDNYTKSIFDGLQAKTKLLVGGLYENDSQIIHSVQYKTFPTTSMGQLLSSPCGCNVWFSIFEPDDLGNLEVSLSYGTQFTSGMLGIWGNK